MSVDMSPRAQQRDLVPPSPPPTLAAAVQSTQAPSSALNDITAGSIAGSLGKLIEFPFDTVKVRLQSQPDHFPPIYRGPIDCFRKSWRAERWAGLYRGVSAPLAGAAAETACLFWSYRVAQEVLVEALGTSTDHGLGLSALVTAGAMSGGVTSLILTPIELVKCRMQVPLHGRLLGPLGVIADIHRREGVRGFWRGQLGTFVRETGGTAAWFGSYEATSMFFKKRMLQENARSSDVAAVELPLPQQLFSGALAGMSYNFLFYPADTIKSKIQTGELTHVRPTFMRVGTALWRSHGFKGLYRGCGITVARSAPSSALIFFVVEELKRAFAR